MRAWRRELLRGCRREASRAAASTPSRRRWMPASSMRSITPADHDRAGLVRDDVDIELDRICQELIHQQREANGGTFVVTAGASLPDAARKRPGTTSSSSARGRRRIPSRGRRARSSGAPSRGSRSRVPRYGGPRRGCCADAPARCAQRELLSSPSPNRSRILGAIDRVGGGPEDRYTGGGECERELERRSDRRTGARSRPHGFST